MSKTNLIDKLTAAFTAANDAAFAADPGADNDGGTCNLDTPGFYLPKVPESIVKTAARNAGVNIGSAFKRFGSRYFMLFVPLYGMADRRTKMMEAAVNALRDFEDEIPGFVGSGWYAMD